MNLAKVLNSAFLLLLRSFCSALHMVVSVKYFLAYMAGDMCQYLAQKLVRGDFLHWSPIAGMKGLAPRVPPRGGQHQGDHRLHRHRPDEGCGRAGERKQREPTK